MNKVKKTTINDRIRNAWRALRDKPASSISLGIDVKRCDECDRDALENALDNSTKEFLKLHDKYQNAKTETAKEIIDEIIDVLQGEIDQEETHANNAFEDMRVGDVNIHRYAEDKLDTIKLALEIYKKKYTEK